MGRLRKKTALMNIDNFKNILNQLSSKGRDLLQDLEEYKFSIEQSTRLLTNDQHLAQKILQKKKIIDQASGLIYSMVFEIENIDITKEYNDQAEVTEENAKDVDKDNKDTNNKDTEKNDTKKDKKEE